MGRESQIVRASAVNIAGNVALAITKGAIGTITGSIAITLDAINSFVDALGSVIAIIGTKLAGKPANRKHPFGYGRIEYLTSIIIAAIILATGFSSFIESIKSILNPTEPTYGIVSVAIVALAAATKFGLGVYLLRRGKALDAGTLVASGTDSLMDGFVSASTVVAAILYLSIGLKVESYLAAVIALLIVKSGGELLFETASKILGERMSPQVAEEVEQTARSVEGVRLANGLVLQDYGPNRKSGSIHVTVDGRMTVAEFDAIARKVQNHVYETCGVTLSGVTPYADATRNKDVAEIRATVGSIVWKHDHVVELRGLYVDETSSTVRFDAVVEFGLEAADELRDSIVAACKEEYPDWSFDARVIPDVGD